MIPAYGWRSVFVFGGILPLLLAPLLGFWLPESIRYLVLQGSKPAQVAKLLSRVNPQLTFSAGASFVLDEQRAPGVPVAHLFREGRAVPTLLMWAVFFVSLLDLFLLTNWLPTVFHDSGVTLSLSVIATALFSGGGVLGTWALGRIVDRFGPYRVLSVNYFLGAVFVALLGVSHSISAIMVCTFFAGVGIIGGQIGANLLAASYYPTFIRSTGVGWALGIGRIGSIVGPAMGGYMLSRYWPLTTVFLASAVPVLFGSAAIYFMGRIEHATAGERGRQTHRPLSEQAD
jgi:AAHS family 4-hydroxybenzoate transporter-like MFS transporter